MPLAGLLLLAAIQTQAQTVRLSLVRTGVSQLVGTRAIMSLKLSSTKPAGLKNPPVGISSPLYGTLNLGGGRFFVILATQGKVQKLFVDSNSNGDMHDDPPATWRPKIGDSSATGRAEVRIPFSGHKAACNVAFVQTGAKTLAVFPDYGFAGRLSLGGKDVPFYLVDEAGGGFAGGSPSGGTLAFDRLGTGQISEAAERYVAERPFTLHGDSFVLKSVSLADSTATFMPGEKVPEVAMPPRLEVGRLSPDFAGATLDGKSVKFPADFHDSVVLVYAWASWSAPSTQWAERVKQVYDAHKLHGFTVLGICLNQAKEADAAKAAAASMPWTTVFDGKSWRGEGATALNVKAVPFLLLVDGATGKIVATMSDMVGDKLDVAIKAALKE